MSTNPAAARRTQHKKPSFPIGEELRRYLKRYRRERELPVTYERLRRFTECAPYTDPEGNMTLWETVVYDHMEMESIHEGLKHIYALLRTDGDMSVMQHLYVDRIDFCAFGNSAPFRVRIVNAYNDNPDHFYVKKGDASRVYGLELEHLLSPNRMHFMTCGNTLVEEHVAGIPGDIFVERWLDQRSEIKPIRLAKELVKFNERCFVRLLGDMRSYNFVVVITPDFEGAQIRIRAMDFDQQSYEGRMNLYRPQFFKENQSLALYCMKHLNVASARQYQREEQALMLQRADTGEERLNALLSAMSQAEIAPHSHVVELREGLAAHYGRPSYLHCNTMGELVIENLTSIRLNVAAPIPSETPRSDEVE
ncbi:hypothetical protein [Ereboglobus luteus]|uniref:Uncharacterized protein n=1 Tax=Ereboglobus luteus TaxID=1796921 RepID=A0A2U8E6V2_9BACT|nr:hypothetical protein [Ereboglobus luteus]AWI10546.1 hypothetical protein CKA38_05985 [Ereboglobus luteus]